MPRIRLRTNAYLTKEKKLSMTSELKKVVDTIPWEDGNHLLSDFEGECDMLFGDSPTPPCATVEFNILEKVYLKVDPEILEKALYMVTSIVSNYCKVPADRIFAYFNPIPMWAWEGINIEKTIIKFDDEDTSPDESLFKANPKHNSCKYL